MRSPFDTGAPKCDCADWGMMGCTKTCALQKWLDVDPAKQPIRNSMKFNVYITMQGPGSTREVPSSTNPVEAENIWEVLQKLDPPANLELLGVKYVGVRVEEVQ